MSGTVEARWVGPGGFQLNDGTALVPGVTVADIPEGEAHESDNWHVDVVPDPPKPVKNSGESN